VGVAAPRFPRPRAPSAVLATERNRRLSTEVSISLKAKSNYVRS
jgi:hypothetical protein